MKTSLYFIMLFLGLSSCRQSKKTEHSTSIGDTATIISTLSYAEQSESIAQQNADEYIESTTDSFYVVLVAEGTNYDSLQQISQESARKLGSRFDMLDRIYKLYKGIIVPESSEDEIYKGDYYPRRPFEDQNFVSIEMATAFVNNEQDSSKMIVLANICKTKHQADSIVEVLKKDFANAKSLKSELYMGCMH